MRVSWILCFALMLAAAWLWLHPSPPPATHTSAALAPQHVPQPVSQTGDPVSHHLEASAAVRAPRRTMAGSSPPQSAAAESGRTTAPRPAAPHPEAAQSSDKTPVPKPAGELFLPFIADDPNQVFAPSTVQYHAALQGETQDPAWGPATENALRGYFARFGDRFEIPYVDCREDLCELQVATRIGGELEHDMRDAQDAMSRIKQEPWWGALEIDQESGLVSSSPDGRALLLWFFSRK